MPASKDILALVEEFRGVVAAAREGNRRELQRIVRNVGDDLKHIARRVAELEDRPLLDKGRFAQTSARMERRADIAASQTAIESIRTAFDPNGCFVYLLWGKSVDCPLYVGLSTNLMSRLGDHMSNPERRSHIVRISLIRCDSIRAMRTTETRLIRQFRPEWNIVGIEPHQNVLVAEAWIAERGYDPLDWAPIPERRESENDMLVIRSTSEYDARS